MLTQISHAYDSNDVVTVNEADGAVERHHILAACQVYTRSRILSKSNVFFRVAGIHHFLQI